jgi:intein-encoded DNA endonuclease-like protein
LLKEKRSLFEYLKKELKNAKLQLEIEYIREESGSQKAYTAADKYKVLAEKNPTLDKLRNMLNLDIE